VVINLNLKNIFLFFFFEIRKLSNFAYAPSDLVQEYPASETTSRKSSIHENECVVFSGIMIGSGKF